MTETPESGPSTVERWLGKRLTLDTLQLIFVGLVLLAVLTRFVHLGDRVMSHDETTHVYFSWLLEQGRGYQHDPLSHGPLQFHAIALSYFLFGDNDASARVPAAVAGVLTIALIWAFRRWLGRMGAVVAGAMAVVSPFLLYYSRYARNEALVAAEALLMVWAVFRYFESRRAKHLYIMAAAMALMYITKETAFIYVAQLALFLGIYYVWRTVTAKWPADSQKWGFIAGTAVGLLGLGAALGYFFVLRTEAGDAATIATSPLLAVFSLGGLAGLGFALAMFIRAFGQRVRTEFPSFDMLVVTMTMTIPQLAALPSQILGWDPLAYQDQAQLNQTVVVAVALGLVALGIGLAWNWRRWLISAAIFFSIFTLFYTTFFTHPFGFFTGLVGSLGYWLVQQGVQRGTQPLYYYILIQIPVYEYLPAIGSLLAGVIGLRAWLGRRGSAEDTPADESQSEDDADEDSPGQRTFPVLLYLGYWALTSLAAFSFAGERMPWLTVHLTLPMILLSGWVFGGFLAKLDRDVLAKGSGWLTLAILAIGFLALARAFGVLLGAVPPFSGPGLDQLRATSGLIIDVATVILAGVALWRVAPDNSWAAMRRLVGLVSLVILFILTARAAFRAAYINYDEATEFLVYAHSARGPKTALAQIQDLSQRTTGGLDIKVAYDNDTSYPYWWYLRNYPNALFYQDNPTRQLADYPVILAGQQNWSKVDSLLRGQYQVFEYNRLWWPMQDYFDLNWNRIWSAVSSPDYREALWQIWFNRDYKDYGVVTEKDMSLRNWSPANKMRLYVRNDVSALIWDAGPTEVSLAPQTQADPYADGTIQLNPDAIVGGAGSGPGQLNAPRDAALAPDGSLFVADPANTRIEHFAADGTFLAEWPSFLDASQSPPGPFGQAWGGIGVAPDGTVYAADTWNHRVDHYAADGQLISQFGIFGQGESPTAFWGPRDVMVDSQGRVFVSDTGNKRVVVFDSQDRPITIIGEQGIDLGQFEEPVGLAMGPDGQLYVADTWNQRIQVFDETSPNQFEAVDEWPLEAWFGQSLDNKPYLAASSDGHVCASDPEGYRILCFTSDGEFSMAWGDYGSGPGQMNLPTGLIFDPDCRAWVVDTGNNRLERFDPGLCQAGP
jgi:predicted membrane-bound mannosyltransferase/sugar lactone lactonase YvrE